MKSPVCSAPGHQQVLHAATNEVWLLLGFARSLYLLVGCDETRCRPSPRRPKPGMHDEDGLSISAADPNALFVAVP